MLKITLKQVDMPFKSINQSIKNPDKNLILMKVTAKKIWNYKMFIRSWKI